MKSTELLQACIDVQAQRGAQYATTGESERSFASVATAFNAITGRDLKGSDVCLILEFVKLVRQYAQPKRLHPDSVLDKVSYSSLWGEELHRELSAYEWPDSDSRVDIVGVNGNDGLHYGTVNAYGSFNVQTKG